MPKKINNICIAYPPFEYQKTLVLADENDMIISNRYNQLTSIYSYPMISSLASTLLKKNGYKVTFLDANTENISTIQWLEFIKNEKLDLIFLEPKTVDIDYYYDMINSVKDRYNDLIIVVAGEHASVLPNEVFKKSKTNYVLSGSDYDLILLNLINYLNGNEKLGAGIYRLVSGKVKFSGLYKNEIFLDSMPYIDRDLTKWKIYSSKNIFFKKNKGTYIYTSRPSFDGNIYSNDSNEYETCRIRSPQNIFEELQILNKRYNICEVTDNSLTLMTNEWLVLFCQMMIESKLSRNMLINSSMSILDINNIISIDEDIFKLMKKAGFNIIYIDINPSKQKDISTMQKEIEHKNIINACSIMSKAQLKLFVRFTIGYPWQNENSIKNLYNLAKKLTTDGYINALECQFAIPYPGTKLFEYCQNENILNTTNWFKYNTLEPIIKTSIDNFKMYKYIKNFNNLMLHPKYILNRILSIRNFNDIKYYFNLFKILYKI